MARKLVKKLGHERTADLVRDLIIIQLGLAGVGQKEIREIVGTDINHINRIVKLLRKKPRGRRSNGG